MTELEALGKSTRAMEESTKDLSELGLEEYVELKLSGSAFKRCIYKVPERTRKIREEAYTPRLVSIGPLHRGAMSLQSGEGDKIKYANSYFSKFPDSEKGSFLEAAKRWEKRARACYDDVIELSSNEFICMILVDGMFVVEFLVKKVYPQLRELDDQIFLKEWVCNEILHDMMLLENQLPFFVLEYLFTRLKEVRSKYIFSTLIDLIYHVFQSPLQFTSKERPNMPGVNEIYHLVYIFYFSIFIAPCFGVKQWKGGKLIDNSSATDLREAGVKFAVVQKECLIDIEFDNKTGELKIPRLVVNQWTNSLLGNLNAFERCQFNGSVISSYIIFMDNLINTPADVELLVGSGIIVTQSSSEDVCTIFNNLYKRSAVDDNKFLLTDLCINLNAYSRNCWHQWKAACHEWKRMLKRDYFSNPWTIISVFAAFILLSLTVIQTVCSVLQSMHGEPPSPSPSPSPSHSPSA